jgi:hypothetical protein
VDAPHPQQEDIMGNDPITAALAAFPALQRLLDLDAAGWVWMPPPLNEQGEPIEVHGVRLWDHEGEVDAMRVRSESDVWAVRVDDDGGIVWEKTGGLVEVVDALIGLPPPASPYAPRLVKGIAPRDMWKP